ncbi:LuxR family transcriptional regulator, maltose regulon positive regulatory protein [Candidatus Planktophila limnetica]|uniref:LuxR family transcriptional regulator, maltose regulon positive regulatory protein n=1 Tax=Candidatus Planktophila limnetica TaxID=573600 RepID=A0A249LG32_9ACTN|nr:LuxR family transcriptional regulator, maltose regulon positive regulatory protein [Candidatus Planktophila limnetica]
MIDGVMLSRTLAPSLPNNLITRKHLFNLLSEKRPGATLVIAPAGYGKTTLVAEWAKQCTSKVIWTQMSSKDSLIQLSQHMIQSVRNAVPGFAPWANSLSDFDIGDIVRKTANEIYEQKENFIWVLDSAEELDAQSSDIRRVFVESVPENVHIVLISRKAPDASYSRFAKLGNLNLVTPDDLLFSSQETAAIAKLAGLDITNLHVKATLDTAKGWPAALQLLVRKLQKGVTELSIQDEIANKADPLSYLAEEIIKSLNAEELDILTRLSIVEEFDAEIADLLIGNRAAPEFFARMCTGGLLISSISNAGRTYHLNSIIRESLQNRFSESRSAQSLMHKKLADLFLERKKIGVALFHASKSEDHELLQWILKNNIRTMAATGKGDFLLQWSKIIGDKFPSGYPRRLSLQVAAHVVNLEFERAQALILELLAIIKDSEIEVFLQKSASVSSATINLFNGNLSKLNIEAEIVLSPVENVRDVENIDKLHVLRLLSNQALALENYEECIQIYAQAQHYLSLDYAPLPMYYVNAISAAASFAEGNYFEAFEIACTGIETAEINDYTGISGSADLHFIRARCLLEFSKIDEALDAFNLVRTIALASKQKVWYILADGYLLRQYVLEGRVEEAFEGIKEQRELIQSVSSINQLGSLVDANEAFLRYVVKDYDRVVALLDRMPEGNLVSRYKPRIMELQGKKIPDALSETLPTKTPRDLLDKYLNDVGAAIDRETEALGHLQKCLDLAALYGAREILLRQKPAVLNLIIKASGARPTVYLEELARAAADRLKKQDQNNSGMSEALTKREIEILKNLSTGKPISAIGSSLHVSQNTMKTHLRNIYRKLEADGRHSAVEKAKSLFLI